MRFACAFDKKKRLHATLSVKTRLHAFNACNSIDNRVLKRDRKRNNVTSQNTYISIGIPCSTSRTY